jgi:hypothetical protein
MIQKDETHTATQPKPEHLLHRSKRTKNQAALGLLGKPPSVLQSILPLQAQRESLSPILRVEPTTFHFGLETSRSFIAKKVSLPIGPHLHVC